MTASLLGLLVPILLVAVTLNLLLTLRLASLVRDAPEPQDLPFTLEPGSIAPTFSGRRLRDGSIVSSEDLAGAPVVLVFLSSACADCRKKLPELAGILPAARRAGVEFFVVGMESEGRIRRFLAASPVADRALAMSARSRRKLNPRSGSPFYLFIDHEGTVKASHFLGDRNWGIFVQQMSEVAAGEAEGAGHEAQA